MRIKKRVVIVVLNMILFAYSITYVLNNWFAANILSVLFRILAISIQLPLVISFRFFLLKRVDNILSTKDTIPLSHKFLVAYVYFLGAGNVILKQGLPLCFSMKILIQNRQFKGIYTNWMYAG